MGQNGPKDAGWNPQTLTWVFGPEAAQVEVLLKNLQAQEPMPPWLTKVKTSLGSSPRLRYHCRTQWQQEPDGSPQFSPKHYAIWQVPILSHGIGREDINLTKRMGWYTLCTGQTFFWSG